MKKIIVIFLFLVFFFHLFSITSLAVDDKWVTQKSNAIPTTFRLLAPCSLVSVSWNESNSAVSQDTLLYPKAVTKGNCFGKQISFQFKKTDGTLDQNQPAPSNVLVTGAGTSWVAQNPGSYTFEAKVTGIAAGLTSSVINVVSDNKVRSYFIDPNGNNANDGLKSQTPWKDFTNLITKVLKPGEQVLLKRGGVWSQQLTISGKGDGENFIRIGAYGSGPRPRICRSGSIADRAMRLNNSSYLKLGSVEVCNGGAGIVFYYDNNYNNYSVVVSDIVAHDFNGIYQSLGQYSSNPSWQTYSSDDHVGYSFGLGITGVDDGKPHMLIRDFRVTDSEIYHTGGGLSLDWGNGWVPVGFYTDVSFDNLALHDNDFPDVSYTSLRIGGCYHCVVTNTVIDRGTGGAPNGTSAIFLAGSTHTVFDNLILLNTPESWAYDNTGIDFEAGTYETVIQNSLFENNAGGAIEFLMNANTGHYNVELKHNTFVNNGAAKKFPLQGQIVFSNWPIVNNSTGVIRKNYYQNPAGVEFLGGEGLAKSLEEHRVSQSDNRNNLPLSLPIFGQPAAITLTKPFDQQSFAAPATIMIETNFENPGTVRFYQGTQVLPPVVIGEKTSLFEWKNVYPALATTNYFLTAKGVNALDQTAISKTVLVSFASLPKGYLDSVDCEGLRGWTCDEKSYQTSLDMEFFKEDGVKVGAVNADASGEEGIANQCGGFPNHRFFLKTPDILKDGMNHQISAYALDTQTGVKRELAQSPRPLVCPKITISVPAACPRKSLGDFNCDDKISLADFSEWRNQFKGKSPTNGVVADANGDGLARLADFNVWRDSFKKKL